MKQKFLKFPARSIRYAPRMQSRRLRLGTANYNVAYKSDGGSGEGAGEGEGGDPETKAIAAIGKQVEGFQTMLGEKADKKEFDALQKQIETLSKGVKDMEAAEIAKAIKDINDANEKIHKQLIELQEKAAEEAENGGGNGAKKAKDVLSTKQVEEFVKATFGENGEKTKNDARIELQVAKAAENFGTATFFMGGAATDATAFTGRLIDPELHQRRRKTNIILDYFDIRTINVPKLIFLVKVEDGDDADSLSGDSGGAAWILCGDEKPKRSFKVTTGEAEAKKIAIFGTVEDCLLQDVPSLENWIREDFMAEMREGINDGLLNNNPAVDPNAPQGVKNDATQFTVTPGFNNAYAAAGSNIIDQLVAAFATMRYRREEPAYAFVSSDNWYKIQILKDANGRYQNNNLVYTSASGQLYIAGVLIVPVDQEDIPSTHFLLIGRDLGFKIYAYGPMVFERGLNADDFRHDRTSYRGFQRFLSYMPTHRENSVMYDTFANVKAGIEL